MRPNTGLTSSQAAHIARLPPAPRARTNTGRRAGLARSGGRGVCVGGGGVYSVIPFESHVAVDLWRLKAHLARNGYMRQ
jgi:hypothetical protein